MDEKAPQVPAEVGAVDIEQFSRNVARMVEEGGKALAAYLKPREGGEIKTDAAADVSDAVKTLGRLAEYWLADPQRALEVQAGLGRAYLDLWASSVKRLAGEPAEPAVKADPRDRRVWRLHLTPAAAPVLREIGKYRAELHDLITAGMTPSLQKALTDGLLQMKVNLAAEARVAGKAGGAAPPTAPHNGGAARRERHA